MQWNVGLHNFKKCSLELGEDNNRFTTELLDVEFERGREISDIFYDHLVNRQTKYVEVLYSGGLDSELVLLSCLRKNIPVKAITMIIKLNDMIINTHDLYYAEKFCRQTGIDQTMVELNASSFFENGRHYDYLSPYYITEPHIATHMWLLEKCSHYPVIGGDWPWTQTHKEYNMLSPFKLQFSSYERFMWDKGIHGIGNMISYSLESSCKMIDLHFKNYKVNDDIAVFKQRMYSKIEPTIEPRLKSHGWENNEEYLTPLKLELFEKLKRTKHTVKWGKTISELLNTPLNENDTFK